MSCRLCGSERLRSVLDLGATPPCELFLPVGRMEAAGGRLAEGVRQAAAAQGLSDHVTVSGRPSCLVFGTRDPDGQPSQAWRTLFLQELVRHGVLGQSFIVSAAHTDADIDHTVAAVTAACVVYRAALDTGSVDGFLHGRPVAPALRALAASDLQIL